RPYNSWPCYRQSEVSWRERWTRSTPARFPPTARGLNWSGRSLECALTSRSCRAVGGATYRRFVSVAQEPALRWPHVYPGHDASWSRPHASFLSICGIQRFWLGLEGQHHLGFPYHQRLLAGIPHHRSLRLRLTSVLSQAIQPNAFRWPAAGVLEPCLGVTEARRSDLTPSTQLQGALLDS